MSFYTQHFGTLIAFGTGILLTIIALPLKYRKIKRNNFYGFRLKYTLQDDDIWYEINAMLGIHLLFQGIVLTFLGIVSFIISRYRYAGVEIETALLTLVVLFGGIGYSLIKGIKKMNEMARAKGLKS